MKFYYIWVEIFSFELKKKKKIDIKNKNMSPKNAIKMINIQKSYLAHTLVIFGLFFPIRSNLVLFGLYGPNKSY